MVGNGDVPASGLEEGCYGAPFSFFFLLNLKILNCIISYFKISLPFKAHGGTIDQVIRGTKFVFQS